MTTSPPDDAPDVDALIQLYIPELASAAAACSMSAADARETLQTIRLAAENDARVSRSTLIATVVVVMVVAATLVGVIAYLVISSCRNTCSRS